MSPPAAAQHTYAGDVTAQAGPSSSQSFVGTGSTSTATQVTWQQRLAAPSASTPAPTVPRHSIQTLIAAAAQSQVDNPELFTITASLALMLPPSGHEAMAPLTPVQSFRLGMLETDQRNMAHERILQDSHRFHGTTRPRPEEWRRSQHVGAYRLWQWKRLEKEGRGRC